MDPSVERARRFALEAHGQQRYGSHPYIHHLDAVVDILATHGPTAQVVGYLHDVAEDTAVTEETLREEFGEFVAACVALVTDAPVEGRAERKRLTNERLAKVDGEESLALVVKVADRLANVRMSRASDASSKLAMYRREHADFRTAAHRPGLCDELWEELDALIDGK